MALWSVVVSQSTSVRGSPPRWVGRAASTSSTLTDVRGSTVVMRVLRCERASASERAARRPAWPGNAVSS